MEKNIQTTLKGGKTKMDQENKPEKVKPDFVGNDGFAIWKGIDKNDNEFLSIKFLGKYFIVFPNKGKE
jgi:hypothetical protein